MPLWQQYVLWATLIVAAVIVIIVVAGSKSTYTNLIDPKQDEKRTK